jgi:hypothetical protein
MSSIHGSADGEDVQDVWATPAPRTTIGLLVLFGVIFLTQVVAARWPDAGVPCQGADPAGDKNGLPAAVT